MPGQFPPLKRWTTVFRPWWDFSDGAGQADKFYLTVYAAGLKHPIFHRSATGCSLQETHGFTYINTRFSCVTLFYAGILVCCPPNPPAMTLCWDSSVTPVLQNFFPCFS